MSCSLSSASRSSGYSFARRRIEAGEHHRLRRTVARQRLGRRLRVVGERVADAALLHVLEAGGDVADLARRQLRHRLERRDGRRRPRSARRARFVRHQPQPAPAVDDAVDDAHVGDHALVGVVLAVEDQRAQRRARRRLRAAARARRSPRASRACPCPPSPRRTGSRRALKPSVSTSSCATRSGSALGRSILLIDGDQRQVGFERQVDVGQRLRLDALRRIDDRAARPRRPRARARPRRRSRRGRACRSGSARTRRRPRAVKAMRTAFALIVTPFSRSRSMSSSTCADMSRLEIVPVISSKRSASVDLPWSMWAMMQKLRIRAGSIWLQGSNPTANALSCRIIRSVTRT